MPEDVQHFVEMLLRMDEEDRRVLRHELRGELAALDGYVSYCKRLRLPDAQRRELESIERLIEDAAVHTGRIVTTSDPDKCVWLAQQIYDDMDELRQHFPLTRRVPARKSLGDEIMFFHLMDAEAVLAVSSYESRFSPQHRYDLAADTERFWLRYTTTQSPIVMLPPKIPQIPTDEDYFSNALLPLIKNVLRHAYAPGEAGEFSVYGHVRKACMVVRVRDYGAGIDPALRDHLFEEGVSSQDEEHGIGLWAVKRFMNGHGGDIACLSPARGACFKLKIKCDA